MGHIHSLIERRFRGLSWTPPRVANGTVIKTITRYRLGDMTAGYTRDAVATVAVLAFFASSWFGWAQERPPRAWRLPLAFASVGSVLLAVLGGVLTWRHWTDGSVFNRASTSQSFGIVVGIEVVVAGIGAFLLRRSHKSEFTPAWIALVVGAHLVPLAPLLDFPPFYPAGVGVAVAAIPVARSRHRALSAVTGIGTGSVLLAAALFSLATVVR